MGNDNRRQQRQGAVTFELDQKALNGGEDPNRLGGSDNKNVEADETDADLDDVEQVDPMIVTVDFGREGKEYARRQLTARWS